MEILNHYYRDSVQPPQSPFLFKIPFVFVWLHQASLQRVQHAACVP